MRVFEAVQGLLVGEEPGRGLVRVTQVRIEVSPKWEQSTTQDKEEDVREAVYLAVMPCTMSISMKVRSGAKFPIASLSLTPVSVNANTLRRKRWRWLPKKVVDLIPQVE